MKSYGVTRPESIGRRVDELWNNFTNSWYQKNHDGDFRYIYKQGDEYCLIDVADSQANAHYIDEEKDIYVELGKELTSFSPVQFDAFCLSESPLPLIYSRNTCDTIELFYHVDKNQAEIWVLDEKGVLFHQQNQYFYDHESMLSHYQRFFQSIMLRRQALQAEQPQQYNVRFYQLQHNKRKGEWSIKTERKLDEAQLSHYLNIQVIATEGPNDEPMVTFFCDNEEISPLEYGNKVLSAVAKLILRHRSNKERYPSYITDLDISALTNTSQGTANHLEFKMALEENLYQEINSG